MANLQERKDAARYMKISVRTLDRFLKKHRAMIEDNKVDMDSLEKWIERECGQEPEEYKEM